MAQQIMGNRILGGIGSSGGGLSTSFGEGVNTALNQRTSRQQMQERDQMMQLRASQEARAQQQFQAQQAAAARAAANAAAQRAAMAGFFAGEAPLAGLTPPSGSGGAIPLAERGSRLSFGATPAGAAPGGPQLSFGGGGTTPIPPGVQLPAFPTGQPVGTLSGGEGTAMLPGGGGADTLAGKRTFAQTPVTTPAEDAMLGLGVGGEFATPSAGGGITLADILGFNEALEPVRSRREAATQQAERQAAGRRAAGSFEAEAEAGDTERRRGSDKDTLRDLYASRTIAGVQMPFDPPVQTAAARSGGTPSERYLNNQDLIQMDLESVTQQMDRLDRAMQYLTTTGDIGGYQQLVALTDTRRAMDQLRVEQRYLQGMDAIAAIENRNFGPLQVLLQQRPEFQGRQVEVRPYTDGTVEIYVDGQLDTEMEWDDLTTDLRSVYDQGYQQFMQAQVEAERGLTMLQLEERIKQAAIAERDIAIANNQAAIDSLEGQGRIQRVGETDTGEAIFESISEDGLPIQYVYREVAVRGPRGEETIVLVATPTDQARVR